VRVTELNLLSFPPENSLTSIDLGTRYLGEIEDRIARNP
jgi:hypothetical protein